MLLSVAMTTVNAQTPGREFRNRTLSQLRQQPATIIPSLQREFRGVWVATVANIDWPSSRALTTDQQKAEMIRLLDRAKELNLNAIIFQVRPQCDALYASQIEPWSEFLTGQMGQAPSPFYDPLEFAIDEAHARGLELHAWFNPYRAWHPSATNPPSPDHISQRRPDLVKSYGRYLWLDPGEKEVQDYSLSVVLDVVRRYDIDGVHFDDYFYPYVERDAQGQPLPFPDETSWQKYLAGGGKLSRDDWRRQNVNEFIQRVAREIKWIKPYVKFGISPFGIWQPGHPPGITGLNAYAENYADSRKWINEGWVDYLTPQLYWPINQLAQSYTALLDWWISQNLMSRHIWPGNAVYKIDTAAGSTFPTSEIINQIEATRQRSGSTGNVHFSMVHFLNNRGGINEALKTGPYTQPALVPPSPWLGGTPPEAPGLTFTQGSKPDEIVISWVAQGPEPVFWWVLYLRESGAWKIIILPGSTLNHTISRTNAVVSSVAVSAVNRLGYESERTFMRLPDRD